MVAFWRHTREIISTQKSPSPPGCLCVQCRSIWGGDGGWVPCWFPERGAWKCTILLCFSRTVGTETEVNSYIYINISNIYFGSWNCLLACCEQFNVKEVTNRSSILNSAPESPVMGRRGLQENWYVFTIHILILKTNNQTNKQQQQQQQKHK